MTEEQEHYAYLEVALREKNKDYLDACLKARYWEQEYDLLLGKLGKLSKISLNRLKKMKAYKLEIWQLKRKKK